MQGDQDFDQVDSEEEDLEILRDKHERLVNKILTEEDELLSTHRKCIDDSVELVKREMALLHTVDKPGSDVDEYIMSLDEILLSKLDMINGLRGKLL